LELILREGVNGSPRGRASFFEVDFAIVGAVLGEHVSRFSAHNAQVSSIGGIPVVLVLMGLHYLPPPKRIRRIVPRGPWPPRGPT